MIIGTVKLLELVNDPAIRLVEGLSERELKNPEGEGLELRVGEVYEIIGKEGFLGIGDRLTPETRLVERYNPQLAAYEQEIVKLHPGDYRLIKTIEKINLSNNHKTDKNSKPLSISAIFTPRTTLQRSGVMLITSNASPGYHGELTFGIYNAATALFSLQLGARICTAIFHETTENISRYRGQWNGGRVSTEGKPEAQV